jgi:RsiW-degrading membrane proteinase PrsW (M82 family)
MSIAFPCPGCRKTIKAKESLAGRKLPCPGCGHALTVPAMVIEEKPHAITPTAPVVKKSVAASAGAKPQASAPSIAPSKNAVRPTLPAQEKAPEPQAAVPAKPAALLQPAAAAKPAAAVKPAEPQLRDVTPWDDLEETEFKLAPFEEPSAPPATTNPYASPQADARTPKQHLQPSAATGPLKPSLAFRAAASNPAWQRRLLWVFALALIPLAFNILIPDAGDPEARFASTIEELDETQQLKIFTLIQQDEQEAVADPLQKLFDLLPEQRLKDAFLAYDSRAHWFMAVAAALLFMGLLVTMAMDGSTQVWHLLVISFFTATGGVLLLLGFQHVADWAVNTEVRGRGIVVLLFWLVKLIGFSYRAAMIEGNGFLESMLGYTFGVGLCEEFCKAIPLFIYFKNGDSVTWRGAMLWGLASGIGFGIAEGIMYSGDYYNGRAYAGIYFVRFFSCVALHAIWTATVAITLYRRQDEWQSVDEWYEHGFVVLKILAIPMLLHGLYDTLLKQDYAVLALVTAAVSFGYLAWLNYHCERHE